MPMRSTFEISTQIILLKIDGFLKGWILNITPLKVLQRSPTPQTSGPFILQPLSQKSVEKWFQKSGSAKLDFFFWSTTFLQPEKCGFMVQNHLFFWSTTFLEPDFSNQISQTTFLKPLFQKSGCRINGPLGFRNMQEKVEKIFDMLSKLKETN